MWTLRLKREGYEALVPEYKKHIIRKLIVEKEPVPSGKMWQHLQTIMGEDKGPSRTSTIIFLNDLVDWNYVLFDEKTGKGGYHRRYWTDLTAKQFKEKVVSDINNSLNTALIDILGETE